MNSTNSRIPAAAVPQQQTTSPNRLRNWWHNAVLYQIYPRSFQDSNGDGIGDLTGITQRLHYVKSLGVNGIWLSPIFKSPMKDFGYDVADYRAIDPLFGNEQDFDTLLDAAHRAGLKVLLDMVLSHTSDHHAWFQESRQDRTNPYADWYIWADGRDGGPPNNWLSLFGGSAWEFDAHRGQYYLHNFLTEQPDLNYHNQDVRTQMLDECKFWLDRGVDGFRLDALNFLHHDAQLRDDIPIYPPPLTDNPYHMMHHAHSVSQPETPEFLYELRALADSYDDIFLLAEIFDDDNVTRTAEYTQPTGPLHSAYSFATLQKEMDASVFQTFQRDIARAHPHGHITWTLENHDVPRIVSRWKTDAQGPLGYDTQALQDLAKDILQTLLSQRGTVILYQGQELGLPQAHLTLDQLQDPFGKNIISESRDGSRTPIPWSAHEPHAGFTSGTPWLPIPPDHLDYATDRQDADPDSPLNHTRRLIAARKAGGGVPTKAT